MMGNAGVGVVSGILRFACFIPLALQGFGALSNYYDIKEHAALQAYPKGSSIFASQRMAAVVVSPTTVLFHEMLYLTVSRVLLGFHGISSSGCPHL